MTGTTEHCGAWGIPVLPVSAVVQVAPGQEWAGGRRFRGKNKRPAWRRPKDAPVSVIRLPLDVSDPRARARLEKLFAAAWSLKRALQHCARNRVEAYWAGVHRREQDAKAWREELRLSRTGLEQAAYAHLEASCHLAHHLTKALAMHAADEVWTGVDRHLFGDATGKRSGRPGVGTWWDFTRICGRARSHTTGRKWETFRLAGTLQGHLDAFGHPGLPEGVTVAGALTVPAGRRVLSQPRHLRAPGAPFGRVAAGKLLASGRPVTRAASWWDHTGPLTLVYTSANAEDLVVPVRLPQGAGRWERVVHYLNRPELWHKIDLVRRRTPSARGGWVYEAHLLILDGGYASAATRERRDRAASLDRRAGIDGNVSNLSVVSAPAEPGQGPLSATMLTLTDAEKARLARERKKAKGRARALERSRRAANSGRYHLSTKQETRAKRRAGKGLPERTVTLPKGPRLAGRGGVPKNAYRTDTLSGSYHTVRARHAQACQTFAEARADRARRAAATIVSTHGANLVVEDCDIRTWARLWGRGVSRFTPGMLISALEREAAACGGSVLRASTTTTALSQHCLCGTRVAKSLATRVHHCPGCELTAPRDLVSATLASCVTLADPTDPGTARVDYPRAAHLIDTYTIQGLQEALSESTVTGSTPAPAGTNTTAATPVASAQRSAGNYDAPTPDETLTQGTTPDRRTRNPDYPDLRDSS